MKLHHWDLATRTDDVHHRHGHHTSHASHALKVRSPLVKKTWLPRKFERSYTTKQLLSTRAAIQVHVDVGTVSAALIGPTLEVLLLIESNLQQRKTRLTPPLANQSDIILSVCNI